MFKKKEKKSNIKEEKSEKDLIKKIYIVDSDYKFKFINRPIPVSYESDISYEFNELKDCLTSEGVNLSLDDILKSFDMWLRLMGLGRSTDDNLEIEQILSMCGPVVTFNPFENASFSTERKQQMVKAFISTINLIAEDDLNSNLTSVETAINGLEILFKEFSIFWNDITKLMYTAFCSEHPKEYSVIVESENDISKFIKLSVVNDTLYGPSIIIYSTVVGYKAPKNIVVVKGTYKTNPSK